MIIGTTPKRTHGNPAEHSFMGHVAHQLFVRIPSGEHMALSNPSSGRPPLLSEPSASDSTKSFGRETRVILVYTTKSTLDGTIQSHFRQPTYTSPPAERKDRNDNKLSLPRFLTASYRTMMTLPPPQRHHNKPKSLPIIKRDIASDTIKRTLIQWKKVNFLT